MGGAEVALPTILDLFEHAVVRLINYNATTCSIEKKTKPTQTKFTKRQC